MINGDSKLLNHEYGQAIGRGIEFQPWSFPPSLCDEDEAAEFISGGIAFFVIFALIAIGSYFLFIY